MEILFNGKRALVTGAGRGIGREVAKRLVKSGAKVVALSRTEEHLLTLKKECPSIEYVVVDIGNWDETKKAVEDLGHFDLLVNNAGIPGFLPFGAVTEEFFDKVCNVNLKGALNVSQVVVNGMKSQGTGGSIVNVSSLSAVKVFPFTLVYGSVKAGLDQMSRVMAVELGPHKIRVNTVNLGIVDTDMAKTLTENSMYLEQIPLKRYLETSDSADTILFLLSDQASMIHGANIIVDGGHMHA